MIQVSTIISNANTELQISGQRVDETDMFVYLNKAIKYFYKGYKLPQTERETDLLLFNGVREYSLPSDFAGIIEPKRPYDLDSPNFEHNTAREFVHWLVNKRTAIKFNKETPYLLVEYSDGVQIPINLCESLTDDGTWTISGDGSSLALDEQIFSEGEASIRFYVTASGGTTTLVCNGFSSLDLTDYLLNSYIFFDLFNPNAVDLTSVTLRIGNDASNYYQISGITTRHNGDTLGQGNGLIGFDMADKTEVGSVDDTAVDYLEIEITHGTSGTVNGYYRIDNIFLSEAVYFKLPYYSKYSVKNGSAYKEAVTATDDQILIPFEAEEGVEYKALEQAAVFSLKDQALATYFARELLVAEKELRKTYPSQQSHVQSTWYKNANKF